MPRLSSNHHFRPFEILEDRVLLAVYSGGEWNSNPSPAFISAEVFNDILDTAEMDIPNLSSKSDSSYTIYLDFSGHTTSGTNWNVIYTDGADFTTPPFDLDGDISSFSVSEKSAIYEIWLRVSEDFIPFDLNVTTVEPDASQFEAGRAQRVVIGGTYSDWYGASAGGVSWDSFAWPNDTPNFVFSDSLDGDIKRIAETISHEVGHTLCLYHKGNSKVEGESEYYRGTEGWAPIMGTSYFQELTQWSKGEYYGATSTKDDLAIITTKNGFGYRDDDYSDTFENAEVITITDGAGECSGIIETNTDVDFFVFESDGSDLAFRIGGLEGVTNLDILVNIYDDTQLLVASFDPADTLYAEFIFSEKAGTYYISVEGTGLETDWPGIYSDYGSLGAYTIQIGKQSALIVTTLEDSIADDGLLSLREAVLLADDQTCITFDSSLAGGVIKLTNGEIYLCRSIQIDASEIGGITIDAECNSRLFNVTGNVSLISLTLTGGGGVTKGAAIYNSGTLTLSNLTLTGNIAAAKGQYLVGGGALYNALGATAVVNTCKMDENKGNVGGTIFNAGTLTISKSEISTSSTWFACGGAVYNKGDLRVESSMFYRNASPEKTGSLVGGGAIYNAKESEAVIISTSFTENQGGFGGAILNLGTCSLFSVEMTSNRAVSSRGGALFNYGVLEVTDSLFAKNSAALSEGLVGGGALYNSKNCSASVLQSLFYGNTALLGGAMINAGDLMISLSTIAGNKALEGSGGGILNAGSLTVTNSIVAENTATKSDDDIYLYEGGCITGFYTLSSFANWTESESVYLYDPSLPLFVDREAENFRLADLSQAIDAGDSSEVTVETDLSGETRIINSAVDLGVYEYQGFSPIEQLSAPSITTGTERADFVSYGANQHRLIWTEIENAFGYEIAYSNDGISWKTLSVFTSEAVITGLNYGTTMAYKVRALGNGVTFLDSEYSEIKSFLVCPMDVNNDGDISSPDRSYIAAAWLSSKSDEEFIPAADINGDGDISGIDRAYLANNWLCSADEEGLVYPPSLISHAVELCYESGECLDILL